MHLKFSLFIINIIILSSLFYEKVLGMPKRENCLIDLSYPFDEDTVYWVDSIPFRFTRKMSTEVYAANEFEVSEHGGTHFDAPYHFNKEGWKVGDIPIDRFFVNG